MDPLQAHFLATVGELLDAARIGRLQIRIELADGRFVEGTPGPGTRDGREQLDDTGQPRVVDVGGTPVPLAAVRQATLIAPLAPPV